MSSRSARFVETASSRPQPTALTALTGQDRLRAVARQNLDRRVESLSDLLDTDCSYVAVLDERREYFVGTHDFVLTALDVSLTPDRAFLTSQRGLRVSHHMSAEPAAETNGEILPERLDWKTSAAVRLPWLTHDPAVIVGTAHRAPVHFGTDDSNCLRRWARDLQQDMVRRHLGSPNSPPGRTGTTRVSG